MEYIALDAHGAYNFASIERSEDGSITEAQIPRRPGAIAEFLGAYQPGSPVARESVGNWYWIADQIKRAGMSLRFVHAYRAKVMIAGTGKTDRLDARGLNRLQRTGTLPTVWIPPCDVRDRRDLVRTRMGFSRAKGAGASRGSTRCSPSTGSAPGDRAVRSPRRAGASSRRAFRTCPSTRGS
jgi:hypothetical protein